MSSWLVWTTLPQKNPNCTVFVKLDYRAASSPIAQVGLLRPPGEGELQTAMNQRGSWEAARPCRLSLEATAYISSSHRCRGKCGRQVGGYHTKRTPHCACRSATSPYSPHWAHTTHSPHRIDLQRAAGQRQNWISCLRCVLMSPEGTTGKPLPSDPQCPPASNTTETSPFMLSSSSKTHASVILESHQNRNSSAPSVP